MPSFPFIWDIWKRAETGPIVSEKDFNLKIFWPTLKRKLKEHDITYDPASLIPTDESLYDSVFKAGMELLLEVGIFCLSTSKIIKLKEEEIKNVLKLAPTKILGEGKEQITMKHREMESHEPPIIIGGPAGAPISEEMAIPIYMSVAREPIVDMLWVGSLSEVHGTPVRAYSPIEVEAEIMNIVYFRAAFRKVGRPGFPVGGSPAVSPVADVSASSEEFGWKKTDDREAFILPNLKTDYDQLSKVAHWMHYGCEISGGGQAGIGGFSGGPEGSAVTTVAECLASYILYQATSCWVWIINSLYPGTTSRMTLWANNVASGALNKNTKFPVCQAAPCIAYAGPCTEMNLYEVAASTIGATVVGSHPFSGGGRQGAQIDYVTGMESRFTGEVAYATIGLKIEDANDIIETLVKKYEGNIERKEIPIGKKFQECYDIKTVEPTKEYLELYKKVRKNLEDIGLKWKFE